MLLISTKKIEYVCSKSYFPLVIKLWHSSNSVTVTIITIFTKTTYRISNTYVTTNTATNNIKTTTYFYFYYPYYHLLLVLLQLLLLILRLLKLLQLQLLLLLTKNIILDERPG